jgi:hypothetical protein
MTENRASRSPRDDSVAGASQPAPVPSEAGPPQSFHYPPYQAYPLVAPKANGYAIASLVLGILWVFWVGSVLALVFGYIAKAQIEQSRGAQSGRGMAIGGIVLGWVGVGFLLLYVLFFVVAGLVGIFSA